MGKLIPTSTIFFIVFTATLSLAEDRTIQEEKTQVDRLDRTERRNASTRHLGLMGEALELAISYDYDSHQDVGLILARWQEKNFPIDELIRRQLPEICRAGYEVFEDFYDPLDLTRIDESLKGVNLYPTYSFIVVQGSLNVSLVTHLKSQDKIHGLYPTDDSVITEITIQNFRPMLDIGDSKIVYLTERRKKALEDFLNEEVISEGDQDTKLTNKPKIKHQERGKRVAFLSKYIRAQSLHWGVGWYLTSHPLVTSIEFNKEIDRARVYFRIYYRGGTANYKKVSGKWELVDSRLSWIE